MKIDEISILCEEENMDERINELSVSITPEDYIKINNLVAIPVEETATFYDTKTDIEIVDAACNEIGTFCFCREVSVLSEFTNFQLVAYLSEVSINEYRSGNLQLNKNYVVVKEQYFEQYRDDFLGSAPVWGNFSHAKNSNTPHIHQVDKLKASKLKLPTEFHEEAIIRAIQQPYGFERFLKTYHLLELLFDYDFVMGVKGLDDELRGIGKLIKEYNNKEEIDKLQQVVYRRMAQLDVAQLAKLLASIKNYEDLAIEIFFEYGKNFNPIKPQEPKSAIDRFREMINDDFPFNKELVKRVMGHVNTDDKYKKFLVDIATYWIYRIRCSIAHHKIGEYLMKHEDEKFVVEVIEPLIRFIVAECFAI